MQPETDTTKVIELAIRTAFYGYLPSYSPLKHKYHFGDSILFTSNVLPLKDLPEKVDTLNFKILPTKEIFSILRADSNSKNYELLPNYLNLQEFIKTDSGYTIRLQSLSTLNFGSGGDMFLFIRKEKDSFVVKERRGGSIN